MSQNKLISTKNVILNLLDSLALDHTKYTPMFTNWILWAEKQIGSYYSYTKKHKVLTIKGCTAELPQDAVYLEIAIMGDLGDCCADIFDTTCLGLINANTSVATAAANGFLILDLGNQTSDNLAFGFVQYVIQDNKIVFLNSYDGQKVTIQYQGMETDCDDIPLINQNHLEALEEYCMYKFRTRRIKSGIDLGLSRDHENRWRRLCASAKADDAMPSHSETVMIGEMINNPFAGKSLWLGQYPTNGSLY